MPVTPVQSDNGNIIEVIDLQKSYGPLRAVDGVSFTVAAGEVFGILGPNGAGKTTTVEILEGMRPPDAGIARINGIDVGGDVRLSGIKVGTVVEEILDPNTYFAVVTLSITGKVPIIGGRR